jgi:hypothetical protein
MMELMSQQALEIGAQRRRELVIEQMRAAKRSDGVRHAAGIALIAVGRLIAGEMPASGRQMQPKQRPATAR